MVSTMRECVYVFFGCWRWYGSYFGCQFGKDGVDFGGLCWIYLACFCPLYLDNYMYVALRGFVCSPFRGDGDVLQTTA